mgnify:CR=1 FL=1
MRKADLINKIAEKTNIQDDILSCLVTENHTIPVGEFIFWDWED